VVPGLAEVDIRIADITFSLIGLANTWAWPDGECFETSPSGESPDVVLRVHAGLPCRRMTDGDLVQSVEGLRNIYVGEDEWAFEFCPHDRDAYPRRPPRQILVFDRRFTSGDLYLSIDTYSEQPTLVLRLFISELLTAMLPFHRGMMIHACGLSDSGRGLVFAGSSGAGKSTMAGLWQRHAGANVLNDDRLILRKNGGRWWAYSVPGVGRPQRAPSQGVAVAAMFLLSHGHENAAERKGMSNAASSLLPHVTLPTYDTLAIGRVLELLEELLKEVPLFELGFVPDETAVDYVRGIVRPGDGVAQFA
jgi:hypothetical protein